ncbi:MAG: hypothetical protein M3Q07_18930 [Pseudobdellovibrionaceae bacterium]|nr:hypothetical protein [Pseudobdellovibrionaceae bacterium]
MTTYRFRLFPILSLLLFCMFSGQTQADPMSKVERIGGLFRIARIEKLGDKDFRIKFESETKTGKHDKLILRSDHVHLAMQEGQVLRLSAEVLRDTSSELEVTQVLLFLPSEHGTAAPIWLLSSDHPNRDFRGARWLDMHAPQADYTIL